MTDSISISPVVEESLVSTPHRDRKYTHRSIASRFWRKVDKNGPVPSHAIALGPCWLWTGGKDPKGYGQLRANGKRGRLLKAHRVSWSMHNGRLTDWMLVLHRCDNPSCVRPDHLFVGSQRDNVQDAARKGRLVFQAHPEKVRRGEQASAAKLTRAQVDEVHELSFEGATQVALARRFGVSQAAISALLLGKTYRDAYLQRLAAKQLVVDMGRGSVKASDTLFEVGE